MYHFAAYWKYTTLPKKIKCFAQFLAYFVDFFPIKKFYFPLALFFAVFVPKTPHKKPVCPN